MENPGNIIPALGYVLIYICVNLSYVLIFAYVMHTSEHEHIKRMREESTKRDGRRSGPSVWVRFGVTVLFIAPLIVIAIFIPVASTFILLGLPVAFSVINLLIDEYRHDREKKKS